MLANEMFALEEQKRAEKSVRVLMDVAEKRSPLVVECYQQSNRVAFETSAANTEQPNLPKGWGR